MTLKNQAKEVELINVTKKFGSNVVAVDNVSFKIEAGSMCTLLGPSGCGKTTTLRMIAGLEMATSGKILIGGKDVTKTSTVDRDVTMVFQSYALFPHMNVIDNVSYGLISGKMNKEEAYEHARKWLKTVGLEGHEKRLPSELSGGQQQRVAVARALVLEPEVLLFDEPLSNLDAKLRRKMREDIRELQQSLGITSVYVTHDQEEALAISDKIIIMDRAIIAQEGSPFELYEMPETTFVANFMGDSNLVKANNLGIDPNKKENLNVQLGDVNLSLKNKAFTKELAEVSLAIRPESIKVQVEKPKGEYLNGKVVKSSYLGTHIEYTIDSEVGELFVVSGDVIGRIAAETPVFIDFYNHGISIVRD